jgi:DnaJ-class molecular chaperone
MKDLYSVLGVAKDATQKDIKQAFKKLAGKHHPDREGGDEGKFKEIQKAYDILNNEDKRKRYDATGETGSDNIRQAALARIAEAINTLVQQNITRLDTVDIIGTLTSGISKDIKHNEEQIRVISERLSFLNNNIKRATGDIIKGVFEDNIKAYNSTIEQAKRNIELCNEALSILEDCDYSYDIHNAIPSTGGYTSTTTTY